MLCFVGSLGKTFLRLFLDKVFTRLSCIANYFAYVSPAASYDCDGSVGNFFILFSFPMVICWANTKRELFFVCEQALFGHPGPKVTQGTHNKTLDEENSTEKQERRKEKSKIYFTS